MLGGCYGHKEGIQTGTGLGRNIKCELGRGSLVLCVEYLLDLWKR